MFDVLNSFSKEAAAIVACLLGAGLGGVIKAAWDRWISDRTVPTQALLDRLASNQHGLSSRGRKRLQEEAESALNEWRRRLIPATSGRKLRNWPANIDAIFPRGLNTPDGSSYCPTSSGTDCPLFMRLESSNETSNRYESLEFATRALLDFEAQVTEELRARFVRLADEVKLSERLIKVINLKKGEEPRLWILASEIAIPRGQDAHRLLQKLAEEARSWIPGVKVILEIYLPEVAKQQIKAQYKGVLIPPDDDVAKDGSGSLSSSAARYALARNKAQTILGSGIILGHLQKPDKYSIPKTILDERLHQCFNHMLSNENWTTLTVSGAPGSGKTETASLMLENIQATYSPIVLVFSTPESLIDLEKLPHSQNREKVYFDLAKAFCFRDSLIPTHFQKHFESRNAFMDALFELLNNESRLQPVVFVVDDLHARREVREALSNLRADAGEWKLRFVLIGRTEIEGTARENLIAVKCEVWNREQARRILVDWVEKERHRDIDIALNEGWLSEQKKFSIYLIRLIGENVDDLTSQRTNPNKLLRNAIDKHLSSVALAIRARPEPSDTLLLRIENMLRSGVSSESILSELSTRETIDLVHLLGILSWVSHFEAQDTILTAKKIRHWSQGLLVNDQDARDLIEAGGKARIFNVFYGAAMWHDKLVADGCAALYLGWQVEETELGDSLIAEMIDSLNKSDSIDILTLALDTPVLLRIVEAVANTRPSLATAINKLVTTEFMLQLKRNPEWLIQLWAHLWKRGLKAQGSDITPFATVLSRLLPLDGTFDEKCRAAIAKGTDETILALAVKAAQLTEVEQFVQEVEEYAPDYLSLSIAETAVRFCAVSDSQVLPAFLAHTADAGFKQDEICRLWELWCARQNTSGILAAINTFIEQTKEGTSREDIYRLFTDHAFREIATNRSPAEREQHLQQLKQLKDDVVALAQKGKKLASPLAKWVAYFHNPDIVDSESAWIVVADGRYAVPKRPNKPQFVSQIFANLRQSYPHLELAASGEIRHALKSSEGRPELVRDRLPFGFSYTEAEIKQIVPINLWIFSEQPAAESFVTKDKLNSVELAWRPRLSLTT